MKKRCLAVAFILLLVCTVLYVVRQYVINGTNVYPSLERNLADHDTEIIKLIQIHQGKYINSSDEEFKQFSALFDAILVAVDLRSDDRIFFYFYSIYPETDLRQHRINGRIHIGGHAFCENQQDAPCFCSQGRTDSSCQAGPVS